jgi:hypothetical protein
VPLAEEASDAVADKVPEDEAGAWGAQLVARLPVAAQRVDVLIQVVAEVVGDVLEVERKLVPPMSA